MSGTGGKSLISDSSLLNPEFSVRIVVCDHYLTKPIPGIDVIYSDFRGSDIKQVIKNCCTYLFEIIGKAVVLVSELQK